MDTTQNKKGPLNFISKGLLVISSYCLPKYIAYNKVRYSR